MKKIIGSIVLLAVAAFITASPASAYDGYDTTSYGGWDTYDTTSYGGWDSYDTTSYGDWDSYDTTSYGGWDSYDTTSYGGWDSYDTTSYGGWDTYDTTSYGGWDTYDTTSYGGWDDEYSYDTTSYGGWDTYDTTSYGGWDEDYYDNGYDDYGYSNGYDEDYGWGNPGCDDCYGSSDYPYYSDGGNGCSGSGCGGYEQDNGGCRGSNCGGNDQGSGYTDVYVDNRSSSKSNPVIIIESDDFDDDDRDSDRDLDVICIVSDEEVEDGDRVTFEIEIEGGKGPFDIVWESSDLDDDILDDVEDKGKFTVRLSDDEDRYDVSVEVTDDEGERASADCDTVEVEQDEDDVRVVSGVPTGTPSSNLSSVYLSQVPYTGTKEVAAFIGMLLAALIGSAYLVYRSAKNKTGATRASAIEAFKQANLAGRTA